MSPIFLRVYYWKRKGGWQHNYFIYIREGDVCCLSMSSSGMGDRADRLIELRSEGKNHVFRHATDPGLRN
jgi:hypothetical protein